MKRLILAAATAATLAGCMPYTPYVDPSYQPTVTGRQLDQSDLTACREQYQQAARDAAGPDAASRGDLTVALLGNIGQALTEVTSKKPPFTAASYITGCLRSKGYQVR